MKWIVKVIVEAAPGDIVEHEIVTLDRPDLLCPATVGLSIVEGKAILEAYRPRWLQPRFAGTMSVSARGPLSADVQQHCRRDYPSAKDANILDAPHKSLSTIRRHRIGIDRVWRTAQIFCQDVESHKVCLSCIARQIEGEANVLGI
jgi:hypothetical protein